MAVNLWEKHYYGIRFHEVPHRFDAYYKYYLQEISKDIRSFLKAVNAIANQLIYQEVA